MPVTDASLLILIEGNLFHFHRSQILQPHLQVPQIWFHSYHKYIQQLSEMIQFIALRLQKTGHKSGSL